MPISSITARSTITPLTIGCACMNSDHRSPLSASPTPMTTSDESPGMLRASQIARGVGAGQFAGPVVNRRGLASVEPISRCLGVALATLLSCPLHGCTNVSGGAVELSWHLEDATGGGLDCHPVNDTY